MARDTRKTLSGRLTAAHEATRSLAPAADRGTQLNPLLTGPAEAYETNDGLDQHDLLVGIACGLKFDFLLGSAFKATAEAQAARPGKERGEKIELALRYLAQARLQNAGAA